MDQIDRMILEILQEDCTLPIADIAEKVGLSTTPCWRRIQKMEEDRIIERRVAVVNPQAINASVTVFVSIKTNQHNEEWLIHFADIVSQYPEVVGFYRMSGQVDYMLHVVVSDIAAYDDFYKRMVSDSHISDVSSAFAMERIKDTTALPLHFMLSENKQAKNKRS